MFSQQHFKLTRQAALLAVVSAAFPVTGYCVAAGRADFVVGNVVAVAADGGQRTLAKGSEINSGESINTAAGARAQIRFTDGAYVSLQPNTQFRVDDYNYENKTDGKEKGFFSLLKGGLRTITGAIGHINRDRYQVATPSATIGIRGTGYNALLNDGLFVHVGEGSISLTNNAGVLLVTAGDAAFVANFNTLPTPAFQKPATPPASFKPLVNAFFIPEEDKEFIRAKQDFLDRQVVPECSSDCAFAYAYYGWTANNSLISGISSRTGVTTTFSSPGRLTKYVEYYGEYYGGTDGGEGGALGTAGISFSATDGTIGWGRWDNGTTANATVTNSGLHPLDMSGSNEAFHYVTGTPTPNMPTTGTATYSLMGATAPTATDDSGGWGVSNGSSLTANFGTGKVYVYLDVQSQTLNKTYSVSGAYAPISGATFAASGLSASGCVNACSANINGFFAGSGAARAGLVYQINDANVRSVQGATAFTKSTNGIGD